jgi:hypothetical protein
LFVVHDGKVAEAPIEQGEEDSFSVQEEDDEGGEMANVQPRPVDVDIVDNEEDMDREQYEVLTSDIDDDDTESEEYNDHDSDPDSYPSRYEALFEDDEEDEEIDDDTAIPLGELPESAESAASRDRAGLRAMATDGWETGE